MQCGGSRSGALVLRSKCPHGPAILLQHANRVHRSGLRASRPAIVCSSVALPASAEATPQEHQRVGLVQRALSWWDVGHSINDQERIAAGGPPKPLGYLLSRIWALVSKETRLLALSCCFMVRGQAYAGWLDLLVAGHVACSWSSVVAA